MTKIPQESADQKDIIWYCHGSCMPKTLLWSKAILFGWSKWLSKCVRALHFALLGFEAGLERENAWNYWDIFYEDLLQVTFDIRTGSTETVGKSTVKTDNPHFDLEHRVTRLWPRFLKNLRIKKNRLIFSWVLHAQDCDGPRLLFLEGAHDWANVFVRCISHCLALKHIVQTPCQCLRCILQIELSTRLSSSSFANAAAVCQTLLKVRDNRPFTNQLEWWNSGGSPMVQGWMGLTRSFKRCWMDFKDRHWRQPKEPANPHASLHVPHASLYGLLRSCLTRVAASVILCACCAVRCEGEVSERIPSIQ